MARKRRKLPRRGVVRELIAFRPGDLAGPMTLKLLETGETASKYIRRVVAADLGVEPPVLDGWRKNLVQFRGKDNETNDDKARASGGDGDAGLAG